MKQLFISENSEPEIWFYTKNIKFNYLRQITLKQMFEEIHQMKREIDISEFQIFDSNFDDNINTYQTSAETFNLVFYEFEFTFNQKKWKIRRSYKDFEDLIHSINQQFHDKLEEIGVKEIAQVNTKEFLLLRNQLLHLIKIILTNKSYHHKINFIHEFFEISIFNFEDDSEIFFKQLPILKHTGQKKSFRKWIQCCSYLEQWLERWFVFSSKGIGYIQDNEWQIKQYREFTPYLNNSKISFNANSSTLTINFDVKNYVLNINEHIQMVDLIYAIIYGLYDAKESHSQFRYDSFAKQTEGNIVKFFINGYEENYFSVLFENLLQAKKEVFITDWWLSPQIYLKRPWKQFPESRLDEVLNTIANKGVIVYVIVYREIEGTLCIDSAFTKEWLSKCHKNINVIRHPRYYVHLWSHHEKMVIIDSETLFMGGLDLCYGRYEQHGYPLKDDKKPENQIWGGLDYANPRLRDISLVRDFQKEILDRTSEPRMPWRDIALKVVGPVALGMKRHFVQYWNFYNVQFSEKNAFGTITKAKIEELENIKKQQKTKFKLSLFHRTEDQVIRREIEEQKQDVNEKLFHNKKYTTNHNTRAENLARAFKVVQKNLKHHIQNDGESNIDKKTMLLDTNIKEEDFCLKNQVKAGIFKMEQQISGMIMQPLRSANSWSIGLNGRPERSIQNAYIDIIENSNHFIYIENQFFISSTSGDPVKNTIAQALTDRIIKAIKQNQKFCVIIVMPLLPGFEGDITKKEGQLLRIQVSWHLKTLLQSPNSMINQIKKYDQNWQKYLKVYGLRNHCSFKGNPITEIVYVHSKLMIVDDLQAIIGSANINDRSQNGDRDSELAVIMTQKELYQGVLNNSIIKKSQKITQFRQNIFKSLFDMDSPEDPMNMDYLNQLDSIAKINEEFYWNTFHKYPHNNLKTIDDIIQANQIQVDKDYYEKNKNKVKGFVLPYPVEFMSKVKDLGLIMPLMASKIMPTIMFT